MPIDYFLLDLILTPIGAAIGMFLQFSIQKKTGTIMYSMIGFNLKIFICLVVVPAWQSYLLVKKHQDDVSITTAKSWC